MTVIGADGDKSVCLQFFSLAAMDQLIYCNQSAQPPQSGSSAALDQVSYQIQSAQLRYISSPAAISQLVCSGAALLPLVAVCQLSCNVSAHLQYTVNSLAGKAELNCQPASENIEQPVFVITWQVTQLG